MNYNKKNIRDIDVAGKKILMRCDFNVPLDENGEIIQKGETRYRFTWFDPALAGSDEPVDDGEEGESPAADFPVEPAQ